MKKTILFLASDSGDGQFNRLVDDTLKKKLSNSGIISKELFVSNLKKDDLKCFNTIAIMRTPLPGHAKDDLSTFRKILPWLEEYVKSGGGLILMFAESYGKSVSTLNELGELFGIKFAFNALKESNEKNISSLPNMREGKLLKCKILKNEILRSSLKELFIPIDGGHGTQALTCFPDSNWKSVMTGFNSCESKPFPEGFYAGGIDGILKAPVFCAIRKYGNGRVTAFPVSSALWVANSYLPRWKSFLMEQANGSGLEFTRAIIRWTGNNTPLVDVDKLENNFDKRFLLEAKNFSFNYISKEKLQTLKNLNSYKVWIGTIPQALSLDDALNSAAKNSYHALIVIHEYSELNKTKWRSLKEDYKKIGKAQNIIIEPAYKQLDGEGNLSVVFNVDELPEQRMKYSSSNLLEDLLVKLNSYSAIYAGGDKNRIPPWKHGGYNLFEIFDKKSIETYRDRISSGAFLSPIHISWECLPGDERWSNYLMAESPEKALASITENKHLNYVSTGILLKKFIISGPNLIDDDWEGLWYEWINGEEAALEIELEADEEITEVCLWDGEAIIERFLPQKGNFKKCLNIKFKKDMRLHLTAHNATGGKLTATYPLYTRNRRYWAHMGSDQMNDYHNVWIKDEKGSMGIGKSFYEPYGFVTMGFGWGDYIRITPPLGWREVMPQGIEVSSLVCNFQSFHPSPFILTPKGFDFLNDHKRKMGYCDQNLHQVSSTSIGGCLNNEANESWKGFDDKTFVPTRIVTESKLWKSYALYSIPRWEPGANSEATVEQSLEFLEDFVMPENSTIIIGHSMHDLKEKLFFEPDQNMLALEDFYYEGSAKRQKVEKEWDNLAILDFLKIPLATQKNIHIEHGKSIELKGDDMGVFYLKNEFMPGQLFVRAWKRSSIGFALGFDLKPNTKTLKKGDVLNFKYTIGIKLY